VAASIPTINRPHVGDAERIRALSELSSRMLALLSFYTLDLRARQRWARQTSHTPTALVPSRKSSGQQLDVRKHRAHLSNEI